MKKILITGGAGFIGFTLSKKFISEGYDVTILDNLSSKIHSDKSKYNALKNISTFIIGDVCSREDWELAIKDQDIVIHLAAETGTGQSMYEIHNYTRVNVGAVALIRAFVALKSIPVCIRRSSLVFQAATSSFDALSRDVHEMFQSLKARFDELVFVLTWGSN